MIEKDTVKLLRECDAGVKMGISSIDDVLDNVKGEEFKQKLEVCKNEHERLDEEIDRLLSEYHDEGKEPAAMAKGMSWIKKSKHIRLILRKISPWHSPHLLRIAFTESKKKTSSFDERLKVFHQKVYKSFCSVSANFENDLFLMKLSSAFCDSAYMDLVN